MFRKPIILRAAGQFMLQTKRHVFQFSTAIALVCIKGRTGFRSGNVCYALNRRIFGQARDRRNGAE
jgi:hypothetical protein